MTRLVYIYVLLTVSLWCTGCEVAGLLAGGYLPRGSNHANVQPYPNANYPPSNPDTVAIYKNFPPTPYEVIGEVEYRGAPVSSWSSGWRSLREEAAKIGGDAIVVVKTETPLVTTIPQYAPPEDKVYLSHREEYDIYSTDGDRIGTARSRPRAIVIEDEPPQVVGHTPLYGKYVSGVVIKFKKSEER